jgi:4-hydroxybenzoate polyprenyltransferase
MIRALIKSMRLRQWTKNAFVLAALVFDRQLLHLPALLTSLGAFFTFCLLSSSVYLINDVQDVEADRKHPTKKLRPIASGKLPIPVALSVAIVLAVISLSAAFFLSHWFFVITFTYFVINLTYSRWLKHVPLLDVLIIAFGFVLRVGGGVSVLTVQQPFSPWLYVCTTLLALYLGFGKRRAELALAPENGLDTRKALNGYTIPLLDQLITIVSSSTIMAYSLYTFSAPNVPANHAMMITIPFVLYAIFRYLYLVQVRQAGGEPEELLLVDRPLQISIALWGISVLVIFYLTG